MVVSVCDVVILTDAFVVNPGTTTTVFLGAFVFKLKSYRILFLTIKYLEFVIS